MRMFLKPVLPDLWARRNDFRGPTGSYGQPVIKTEEKGRLAHNKAMTPHP